MLVPKKASKKKKIFLAIFIIINIGLIIYFIFGDDMLPQTLTSDGQKASVGLLVVPEIESGFEIDFFTKKPFIDLKQFGQLPVVLSPEEVSKTNPFREIISFGRQVTSTTTD